MNNSVDNLLALGITLRLTRFITTDWLGHWWLVRPARRWAVERVQGHTAVAEVDDTFHQLADLPDPPAPVKLVKGFDCPFCVGFWIGAAVLLSLTITRAVPPLLPVWRFVAGTFALNYVVGHISKRIED